MNLGKRRLIKSAFFSSQLPVHLTQMFQERKLKHKINRLFNPLHSSAAFLYSLKTSKIQRLSDVFRGYRKAAPGCHGLNRINRLDDVFA